MIAQNGEKVNTLANTSHSTHLSARLCYSKNMLETIQIFINSVLILLFLIMASQLRRPLRLFTPPKHLKRPYNDDTAPTVSLCIPARNEQHVMTDCLTRALQSTYPKLEIIVLDDSSKDNTSALIKSFASEGVRFVEGSPLPKGWLGKNHAFQGLLDEASGDYILFLGVDTMLTPGAIDNLVSCAETEKVQMVSVLPRRNDGWRASVFFSPLRYFWELLFARRLAPASSSAAWLIKREALMTRFDGFKAFRGTFRPEAHIAAELAQLHSYRFYISSVDFGVSYEKKWRSQLLTSIRLLYPFFGMKWGLALFAVLDMALLFAPFIFLCVGLFVAQNAWVYGSSIVVTLLYCALYGAYTHRVWQKGWYIGFFLWPLLVLQEVVLLVVSIIAHETGKVTWKGRPIQQEAQN